MKNLTKKTKIIILTIIIVLGLYAGLIFLDGYRFINSEFSLSGSENHKPFITLSEDITDEQASFTGLGYTVTAKSDNGEFVKEKVITAFGLEIYEVKIVSDNAE